MDFKTKYLELPYIWWQSISNMVLHDSSIVLDSILVLTIFNSVLQFYETGIKGE